jgi:signal transduction histidine kinase
MNFYNKKQWWKYILLIIAVSIGISSLYYTNVLVKELSAEEQKNVELWAEATKQLAEADVNETDFNFLLEVIQNNKTIPVIWADSAGVIISHRNLDSIKSLDDNYVKYEFSIMQAQKKRIEIDLGEGGKQYIYYRDSDLLIQLRYYPYIQLGIIILFIIVAYFAFSSSRNAEQNKVWVGLSKETAHQLGTPTSSLMAWVELLKEKNEDNELIQELEKDVNRLEKITDRFSKVGSKPVLKETDLIEVLQSSTEYIKTRASDKIQFKVLLPITPVNILLSRSLFEWVTENIMKNAIDAMEGSGVITVQLKDNAKYIYIDISDTGKGIQKSKFKTVFKPGYTTKARGWGLGLSLAKRIIEDYHKGKIFVLSSEVGKGTTFRIALKKNKHVS